uniref:Receptor activity modifying protein 2 n=1 Tax=Chelydra serpentina TaxID=8475 RepID=A0A8C3SRR9_CHESE
MGRDSWEGDSRLGLGGSCLNQSETSLASFVPVAACPTGWTLCPVGSTGLPGLSQLPRALVFFFPDEKYNLIAYMCWANFSHWMMNVTRAQLCEWRVIGRPYSDLRHCLETFAEKQNYGYPNSIAEECIVQSHRTYFLNCTQEHPVFFDPPEDVLLILILTPICLIPFLVTLVVWRSKDGKMQS